MGIQVSRLPRDKSAIGVRCLWVSAASESEAERASPGSHQERGDATAGCGLRNRGGVHYATSDLVRGNTHGGWNPPLIAGVRGNRDVKRSAAPVHIRSIRLGDVLDCGSGTGWDDDGADQRWSGHRRASGHNSVSRGPTGQRDLPRTVVCRAVRDPAQAGKRGGLRAISRAGVRQLVCWAGVLVPGPRQYGLHTVSEQAELP